MANIHGVILDVDGTLIDSNDALAKSWLEAMAQYGHFIPYEQLRWLIGEGGDKLMPQVLGLSAQSNEGKMISSRRKAVYEQLYMPTLQAFPEVRALLERMHNSGLKVVIGSSAQQEEVEVGLRIANIEDLIDYIISADDAEQSKPSPSIVHVALQKLGLPPDEVVMIGDTPYDIESAAKANVGTIALRTGGWTNKELSKAIAIYSDPADLLAHYDTSPLAS